MITYEFLQQYWWLVISLLAGLLVFLMFVQGANSLIFAIGRTEEEKKLIVNSTGRKWEFTFTTSGYIRWCFLCIIPFVL
jgi:cytochrome d ubiquinol oxidase subunit II